MSLQYVGGPTIDMVLAFFRKKPRLAVFARCWPLNHEEVGEKKLKIDVSNGSFDLMTSHMLLKHVKSAEPMSVQITVHTNSKFVDCMTEVALYSTIHISMIPVRAARGG